MVMSLRDEDRGERTISKGRPGGRGARRACRRRPSSRATQGRDLCTHLPFLRPTVTSPSTLETSLTLTVTPSEETSILGSVALTHSCDHWSFHQKRRLKGQLAVTGG